jgi:transcriptional regulator with XRE-family HTH domain
MPLSIAERKHLMPYGAQKEIAADLGIDNSYVSRVLSGDIQPKTAAGRQQLHRIQLAIAEKLERPIEDVFPETTREAAVA